jgi:hypothetical protein
MAKGHPGRSDVQCIPPDFPQLAAPILSLIRIQVLATQFLKVPGLDGVEFVEGHGLGNGFEQ